MYHVSHHCKDKNYGDYNQQRDARVVKFDGYIAAKSDKNEANQHKSDPISHPVKHRKILKIYKI